MPNAIARRAAGEGVKPASGAMSAMNIAQKRASTVAIRNWPIKRPPLDMPGEVPALSEAMPTSVGEIAVKVSVICVAALLLAAYKPSRPSEGSTQLSRCR